MWKGLKQFVFDRKRKNDPKNSKIKNNQSFQPETANNVGIIECWFPIEQKWLTFYEVSNKVGLGTGVMGHDFYPLLKFCFFLSCEIFIMLPNL